PAVTSPPLTSSTVLVEPDRSDRRTVTVSVEVWLPPVPSNIGCETSAVLSVEAAAVPSTATVNTSVGRSASTAMLGALLLQVTTCPTALQVQPVPVPETKVRPVGSVSVTVAVPTAISGP